jgi:hypothetical protein
MSITRHPVNGWLFWPCRIRGRAKWSSLRELRADRPSKNNAQISLRLRRREMAGERESFGGLGHYSSPSVGSKAPPAHLGRISRDDKGAYLYSQAPLRE